MAAAADVAYCLRLRLVLLVLLELLVLLVLLVLLALMLHGD
jgi:hypothetical protein